jgi:hypothetical protein
MEFNTEEEEEDLNMSPDGAQLIQMESNPQFATSMSTGQKMFEIKGDQSDLYNYKYVGKGSKYICGCADDEE